MVTEQQAEEMRRGFVGGGIVIAAVLSLAAVAAILLGETWAVWPLIPLVAMEIVFVALWIRRRRSNGARG